LEFNVVNELETNGLKSITFLFSALSRFDSERWVKIKDDDGQRLFLQLKQKGFEIREVNRTTWQNNNEALRDIFYSIQLNMDQQIEKNKIIRSFDFLVSMQKQYFGTQIYLNDQFELTELSGNIVRGWMDDS